MHWSVTPYPIHTALTARLELSTSPLTLGMDGSITCAVTSDDTDNLQSTIQLVDPGRNIIMEANDSNSITFIFNPFTMSDIGEYECIATVTSPDFPNVAPIPLTQTANINIRELCHAYIYSAVHMLHTCSGIIALLAV